MPTSAVQRSFASGEVTPAVYGRADLIKYATGCRTLRNMAVARHSGAFNRAGFQFVCEVKTSTRRVRLIKFVFNAEQSYTLEFGHLYMRVIQNGVLLEDPPGTPYEIVTPYTEAHLQELQYVQSGDTVTIVHPSYQPRSLTRTGHTAWTLAVKTFQPPIARPTGATTTGGQAGSRVWKYKVTAVKKDTLEESLTCTQTAVNITAATNANPVVITSVAHGYLNNDEVLIEAVTGMTQLNNREFRVQNVTADTFELQGENGSNHGAYVSGGTAKRVHARNVSGFPNTTNPIVVTWNYQADAEEYNVYRDSQDSAGVFAFLGTSRTTTFRDDNSNVPDEATTPPIVQNVFNTPGDYPATTAYTGGRAAYANTDNEPEKVWLSRSGDFDNFTIRSPLQDNDSIKFLVAGRQVNRIRHLVDIDGLTVLTSGGEWVVPGDSDGVIRPAAINPKQLAYNGSSALTPIIIGNTLLYVQARGSVVRDYRSDIIEGTKSSDLTIYASHLVDGYTITDWDFQQIPHSIAWAVRDDGMLLGMTYLREQEIVGWHRHDTDGDFENVLCIPEGREDALYVVVRRTINGVAKRYIERMHTRAFDDIVDAFFVDSGLTYDGRHTGTTTMTVTGGTNWTVDENLTLTSSVGYFVAGDVGNAIVLNTLDADGKVTDSVTLTIEAYTSATVVTVGPSKTVPAAFRGVSTVNWSKAVDELSGLSHLQGKTVSILVDGNVHPQRVVAAGAIALDRPYSVIHVGLPIEADLETLDLENPQGETLVDKKKLGKKATIFLENSRGLFVGPDADNLREFKQRTTEAYGEPTRLLTGVAEVTMTRGWDKHGRVFIRQRDPLPITVLGVAVSWAIGE